MAMITQYFGLLNMILRAAMSLTTISQPENLRTFSAGDTVELKCVVSGDQGNFYYSWFRVSSGEVPLLILSIYSHSSSAIFYGEFKNSGRFKARRINESFVLTIEDTRVTDEGTYYCFARDYEILYFGRGALLLHKDVKCLIQEPVSESVQPGDSVSLNCTIYTETCAGEHSVYWFRHGAGESHPGIIYTHHGNRSDQCEKSAEAGSPTQSCVYKLPMGNLRLSDAGTYYCAVASCGEILFGKGTKLDIEKCDPQMRTLVFLSILRTGILLCCLFIYVGLAPPLEIAILSSRYDRHDLSVTSSDPRGGSPGCPGRKRGGSPWLFQGRARAAAPSLCTTFLRPLGSALRSQPPSSPLSSASLSQLLVNAPALVEASAIKQDSGLVLASVGDTVTLRCFYGGDMAMHFSWYQQTLGTKPWIISTIYKYDSHATLHNEFKLGIIYTHHGDRSDQCEKSPEAGSPTQSCVYKLPMGNLSLSDAGTYYCAVASCGEILFGNGTKVNIAIEGDTVRYFTLEYTSVSLLAFTLGFLAEEELLGTKLTAA
ncbi:uncharacterized protein FYW47_015968 [Aplochiton taeniatus]